MSRYKAPGTIENTTVTEIESETGLPVQVDRTVTVLSNRWQVARLTSRPQVPVDPDDPGGAQRDATAQELGDMGIMIQGRDVDAENGSAFDADGVPLVLTDVAPLVRTIEVRTHADGRIEKSIVDAEWSDPPAELAAHLDVLGWGGYLGRMAAMTDDQRVRYHRARVVRAKAGAAIRDRIDTEMGDRQVDDGQGGRVALRERTNGQPVIDAAREILRAEIEAAEAEGREPEVAIERPQMVDVLDEAIVEDELVLPASPAGDKPGAPVPRT